MAWEIPDNFFGDQEPQGLGAREQPPTGPYRVFCKGSEYRSAFGKVDGEKSVYLDCIIQNDGDAKGMSCVGVRISPPKQEDSEGLRNVRDSVQRAAILCFSPEMVATLGQIRNTKTRLHSGLFDGKYGHIWYERAEAEGQFPNYRFLSSDQYKLIVEQGFKPKRKNSDESSAASGTPRQTLGTPPPLPPQSGALPVNGGGLPSSPMPPAVPSTAGATNLLG
jgi:hypothetical protein